VGGTAPRRIEGRAVAQAVVAYLHGSATCSVASGRCSSPQGGGVPGVLAVSQDYARVGAQRLRGLLSDEGY
jgi:hypothetical protein